MISSRAIILIFILLSATSFSFAQTTVPYTETRQSYDTAFYQGHPFTGIAIIEHADKKYDSKKKEHYYKYWVEQERFYSNGFLTKRKVYHKADELEMEVDYSNGRQHGTYKEWYPKLIKIGSVKLKVKGTFKEGERDDIWTFYHKNGKKSAQGKYEGGKQVGEWKYWYKNGDLNYEGQIEKISPGKRADLEKLLWPLLLLK